MDDELSAQLRALIDKQEIHEVLLRYCRGVDRMDRALISSAFHPDSISEYGQHAIEGARIGDVLTQLSSPMRNTTHRLGNVLIELDGDSAYGEAYFLISATVDHVGREHTRTLAGRYLDVFARRAGVWAIASRLVVDDWSRLDEITIRSESMGYVKGERAMTDPVYQLLGRYHSTASLTTPVDSDE